MARLDTQNGTATNAVFETISAKIISVIAPYLSDDLPDKEFMAITRQLDTIVRNAWRTREQLAFSKPKESPRYLRHGAIERFGGHCGQCRNYDAECPCDTLDKEFPGCVLFEKEEKRQ